jgi:hypothetical protein
MPGNAGILLDSKRKAYMNAVNAIQSDSNYVCNDEAKSIATGKYNVTVAQSYVWSEIPVNPNNSQYVFNVIDQQYNVGNAALLPAERRVKQQDVFFTYALWFGIRISGGGQGSQQTLQTFPSAYYQGPSPLFFPDVTTLVALWNTGVLNVTVNGNVLTPAWDLSQHLVINQTETSTQGGPLPDPLYNQVDNGQDGFVVVEPNWIINGANNNIYQVNYPNNYNNIFGGVNAGTSVTVNLIMRWYGFLAQNVSSIMNNATKKAGTV